MIEKRRLLTNSYIEEMSSRIYMNIIKWDLYIPAKTIMLYSDIRKEVKTEKLIQYSIENNKTVVMPKCLTDSRDIIPCIINNIADLEKGEYGILEPKTDFIADKSDIDIVFVPGVAFDKKGYRLGYGAGYYDRFLTRYNGVKVGLCYEIQLTECSFKENHDVQMDYLVTEKGITKTGDINEDILYRR